MPHGAPALHTWKVDMMGESLPGGKKRKRKRLDVMQTCGSTHTFTSVIQMYGGMNVRLLNVQITKRKATVQSKQIKRVIVEVFRFVMHAAEHHLRAINQTETGHLILSRFVV